MMTKLSVLMSLLTQCLRVLIANQNSTAIGAYGQQQKGILKCLEYWCKRTDKLINETVQSP